VDEILNPIAEREAPDSGLYCIPSEANHYPDSRFYCIDENCKDPKRGLFLKKSNRGRYFFSHYGNYQHEISPETLLHKLTIKSFEGLKEFELPTFKDEEGYYYPVQTISIDPSKTALEFRELEGVRPDVTITSLGGMQLGIEIFVTNRTKEKKIQRLEGHKLPTLEINLEDFYRFNRERCKTDISFIKENALRLVCELKRKSWLATPKPDQIIGLLKGEELIPVVSPPSTSSPGEGCLFLFIFSVAILILCGLL
jgi:hypothetical protein